ncbi:hypothetical protein [Streptosporangium saharense]|uniref:hypothetical protein n=1 Tax=Streptosporangium saharense TaxID=1706840 RepID=UPI00331F6C08
MKAKKILSVAGVLACVMGLMVACGSGSAEVDNGPLPTVAAPPYVCGYLPLKAVELMTGVRDPIARGSFDLTLLEGVGYGTCTVYRRDDDQLKMLQVGLTAGGYSGKVEEQVKAGAPSLPEIVPGAVGYYFRDADSENNAAYALLSRGKAQITVQLEIGVEGRDGAADVLALMKLIAPRLITDAGAPSAKAASPTPEGS